MNNTDQLWMRRVKARLSTKLRQLELDSGFQEGVDVYRVLCPGCEEWIPHQFMGINKLCPDCNRTIIKIMDSVGGWNFG